MRASGLAICLLVLVAPVLYGQGPAADWKTLETAHFRVYFPVEYEEWATRAATRLESIREAVTREVGFAPETTIDVVVMNPIAQANGIAWPLLDTPRIVLYTDAPGPEEQIGEYGHWIDLLTVHEVTHIVHMLRPSRNPLERALEKTLLPLNRITLRAPRWVLEGYATVIEGRLTGAGRPNSTIRAAILRKWAQAGRLPSYSQLNADHRFLGMSMAYLAGSAYLEWLEGRAGEGSLRKLWARLTARQRRTFDQAFEGVFGDSPERLYGRFTAEVTASAVEVERAAPLREGELWQVTPRASGDPVVSPDGSQLAMVLRPREGPQRLVVYATAPPIEEEKKDRERIEKMLARDPVDVAPVRVKPIPRDEKHGLTMPDGGDIGSPRWLRAGNAILFTHRTTDPEGFLHRDLFVWTPESGDVRRVTHLADVGEADPYPGEARAVAVRRRFGKTQLVTVDLATGAVTPLTDASIDDVVSHPRVSPDGTRVASIAHRDGRWGLYVDQQKIDVADASSPEWLSDTELVATLSSGGFAELHRIALDGTATALTRSSGGAFEPTPSRDHGVYFMALETDGFVVRRIEIDAPALPPIALDHPLVPALPPTAPSVAPFAAGEVSPPRDYGIGRQEFGWFTGQNYAADYRAFELGVRWGDVVGRLDTLVIGSLGADDAPRGAAVAAAWRGWPIELGAHAYFGDEHGFELNATWSRKTSRSAVALAAAFLSDRGAFATALLNTHQMRGKLRIDESLHLEINEEHYRAIAALTVGRVGLRYRHDDGDAVALGGLASSILPRSSYANRVLDPALPLGTLSGERYDGWRVDTTLPFAPVTAFYQRHTIDGTRLSLAGLEFEYDLGPDPILKTPGLHLTAGAARLFDSDQTRLWLGLRWRP